MPTGASTNAFVHEDSTRLHTCQYVKKTHALKLLHNVHSQKQAGRVWNQYLDEGMIEAGFTPSSETHASMTEFRQPRQVQSHLEMPGILVQLGHTQRT